MRKRLGGVLAVAVLLATPSFAQPKEKSLYDRLGGKKAITAVVDEFVARCAADKRINHFFTATASDPARLQKFKANLVDQICEAGGGPCKYAGKDMKTAHAGMGSAARTSTRWWKTWSARSTSSRWRPRTRSNSSACSGR